jgi:hypothetical protein
MEAAQNRYMAFANGNSQILSDAVANNMGGSSYLSQILGQNHAMNQLGAWGAGIEQQNSDFARKLQAYDALYRNPIGLTAQQNLADVQRGLGVAGIAGQSGIAENQYNLQNTLGQNQYNLGANQIGNNFGLGRYQGQLQGYATQTNANTQRGLGGLNFLSDTFRTAVGSGGLF